MTLGDTRVIESIQCMIKKKGAIAASSVRPVKLTVTSGKITITSLEDKFAPIVLKTSDFVGGPREPRGTNSTWISLDCVQHVHAKYSYINFNAERRDNLADVLSTLLYAWGGIGSEKYGLEALLNDTDPPPPLNHIVFRPVEDRWMNDQCAILGLQKDKFGFRRDFVRAQSELIKVTEAPDRENMVEIKGDGNSLFRALSWWITGSDYEHLKLRRSIVGFMFKFPDEFGEKMSGNEGQKYTKENNGRMLEERERGTQCEIYGAATLLGADIYTFSERRWERFRPLFEWTDCRAFKVTRVTGEDERTHFGLYLSRDGNMHYDVVYKCDGRYTRHARSHAARYPLIGEEPCEKRMRMDEGKEKGSFTDQLRSLFDRPKIDYEETKRRLEEVAKDVSKLESSQKEELVSIFLSFIDEKNK